jgi:hypothetical protein
MRSPVSASKGWRIDSISTIARVSGWRLERLTLKGLYVVGALMGRSLLGVAARIGRKILAHQAGKRLVTIRLWWGGLG